MEEWAVETIPAMGRLGNMASQYFRRQLEGYGLTTANILYRRPDHPWLLQTYVWQDYDLCPMFPYLNKFLNFWLEKLEGPLHSVTVAHALALPQLAFAHGQSLVPTQDSVAFARWESMGSAGPEPIQSIDGKRIPGAPNGMVAEMESPRSQAMGSSTNTSAVNNATTRNGASETNNAERTGKNLPQEIQAKLKDDGFSNVKVVPGSFIVSAKDKRGEPVTMMIGPNSMMMVTQVTNGNSPSTNNQK